MKHIKTACAEETQAKKEYASVTSEDAIVADGDMEKAVARLYELSRKSDEIALEMSGIRAQVMSYMKGHSLLTSADGRPLCSWKTGRTMKKTDWDGLCKEFGITEDDVVRFTGIGHSARLFSIEID